MERQINYLNKDFNQFKTNLLDFVKVYFRDTITNISPTDPAMMFVELASYVGDVLSFYTDYQFKENQLLFATEQSNIIQLAQMRGYKPRIISPAKVEISVYQIIPSILNGSDYEPDWNYALQIKAGMKITSNTNNSITFRTLKDIDFGFSNSTDVTDVTIYELDDSDNPIFYLLKKNVIAEASDVREYSYQVTDSKRYLTIEIPNANVIGIESVYDGTGNRWYETEYLAQDTIFEQLDNTNEATQSETPYVLRFKYVPKRFITRYNTDNKLELRFGSGNVNNLDETVIPHPANIGLTTPMQRNVSQYDYDVSNFLFTDSYGQLPFNTTLTIKYIIGNGIESNVISNVLQVVTEVEFSNDTSSLDMSLYNQVTQSLSVNNDDSAVGGRGQEDVDSIRENALSYFSAQDRAVTREDYILRALSLPHKFGTVSKADVERSHVNKNEIDLSILCYDDNKNLVLANDTIKENLTVYLDRYRMMTDIINIIDAYIVNISVKFNITTYPNFNNKEVLLKSIVALQEFFNIDKWAINQPIIYADIMKELSIIEGVKTVQSIEIENKFDYLSGYASNYYDILSATRNGVIYPSKDAMIFEVKFKNKDITGRVVN